MTMTRIAGVLLAALLYGCGGATGDQEAGDGTSPRKPDEPDYISIEYLRVGFEGLPGDTKITRSREEAKARAEEALRRAEAGEDFAELVEAFSDDEPRAYQIANADATPRSGYFMRAGVVRALGDVGFSLARGEAGLAAYDEKTCPYGYYVIKRTE